MNNSVSILGHTCSTYLLQGGQYYCQDENAVIGYAFMLQVPFKTKIKSTGSQFILTRITHTISKLTKLKNERAIYYGDYHGETIVVGIKDGGARVSVALVTGHCPNNPRIRAKGAAQFVKEMRASRR